RAACLPTAPAEYTTVAPSCCIACLETTQSGKLPNRDMLRRRRADAGLRELPEYPTTHPKSTNYAEPSNGENRAKSTPNLQTRVLSRWLPLIPCCKLCDIPFPQAPAMRGLAN